jgi:hypothetical protein
MNNNNLLNNREMFNNLNSYQLAQLQQNINNSRTSQQSKLLMKINELEKNKDKLHLSNDELRNVIIRPIKLEKANKQEIYKDLEKITLSKTKLEELWKKRTNNGYKHIIKDEKYQNKKYEKKEDLIIHKVTDADKLGIDNDYNTYANNIENQNGELKVIYSTSKELEHKKKFEYNNKYKYSTKYNPNQHENLKDDNIEYFKKEQEKSEKDKKTIDNVIENLINVEVLTDNEKNELDCISNNKDYNKDNNKDYNKDNNKDYNKDNNKDYNKDNNKDNNKNIKITIIKKDTDKTETYNEINQNLDIDTNLQNKYLTRKKKN